MPISDDQVEAKCLHDRCGPGSSFDNVLKSCVACPPGTFQENYVLQEQCKIA